MTTKKFSKLKIVDHPLALDCVTHLRDVNTEPRDFHRTMTRISYLLAYAAMDDLKTQENEIATPLEKQKFPQVKEKVAIVPVLRAGLGLVEGFRYLYADSPVGYIGIARDHKTLAPKLYLCNLPRLEKRRALVLDPMLATGGSACMALKAVKDAGAESVRLVTVIAAPEGVSRVEKEFPDVIVYTIALDRCLNEKGYILPGLGDAGDRMHGTGDPEA